jgi:hypothetical protein
MDLGHMGDMGLQTRDWIHMAVDLCQHEAVCEHSNEPLFSIEDGEFLEQLTDRLLLKSTLVHGVI